MRHKPEPSRTKPCRWPRIHRLVGPFVPVPRELLNGMLRFQAQLSQGRTIMLRSLIVAVVVAAASSTLPVGAQATQSNTVSVHGPHGMMVNQASASWEAFALPVGAFTVKSNIASIHGPHGMITNQASAYWEEASAAKATR